MEDANQIVPLLKHLGRIAVALVWCVMTMAFLVVPYAMGDAGGQMIGATHLHSDQAAASDNRVRSVSVRSPSDTHEG